MKVLPTFKSALSNLKNFIILRGGKLSQLFLFSSSWCPRWVFFARVKLGPSFVPRHREDDSSKSWCPWQRTAPYRTHLPRSRHRRWEKFSTSNRIAHISHLPPEGWKRVILEVLPWWGSWACQSCSHLKVWTEFWKRDKGLLDWLVPGRGAVIDSKRPSWYHNWQHGGGAGLWIVASNFFIGFI